MGDFTIVGLRVVREAAMSGSFSTAAENLGYTQSAVSRQIALMEQAAGRALFERHARGVRPTAAGRIVVRHADAVLGELGTARHDLDTLAARPPALLRVGAFSTAMAVLVLGPSRCWTTGSHTCGYHCGREPARGWSPPLRAVDWTWRW
jgi:DNA-binding transcriptional LysR family regulator